MKNLHSKLWTLIRPLSSVFCLLSSVLRHPSSAFCPLFSVTRQEYPYTFKDVETLFRDFQVKVIRKSRPASVKELAAILGKHRKYAAKAFTEQGVYGEVDNFNIK